MNRTKIQFSDAELDLMQNPEVILTKNSVIAGVVRLFANLQEEFLNNASNIPALSFFRIPNGKISKGENYIGLPYVMLDYPRQFEGNNIFAIRTMFWWGKFFSMTLHLAGEEKMKFLTAIENNYDLLSSNDFYIGINEDHWQHHFEKDNYTAISNLSREEFIDACRMHDHLKIATKWPIESINEIENSLKETWLFLARLFDKN